MELLEIVKYDLGIASDNWNDYLEHLIEVSKTEIGREGITLQDTAGDNQLIVMYTAYLYRKRTGEQAGMPRMLRYALNNRLLSEKAS